tara:strand:+ start:134 stop:418 length:285 start_codon:yes stop_codon:yes gene_type:complete
MSEQMNLNINQEALNALHLFRNLYPTWWYTIGMCDVSSDFTAATQSHSPEYKFAEPGNDFDGGFMYDSRVSLADAIKNVIVLIGVEVGMKEETK